MTTRALVSDRHPGGLDRNKDLKLIHIAKKSLNMADDAYRAIILGVSNQRTSSSADLTGPERRALLNHLKACGFRVEKTKPAHIFPETAEWKLVWSLWQQLADQGKVKNRQAGALVAWVKKQTGVEAMTWVVVDQVIEALKMWVKR